MGDSDSDDSEGEGGLGNVSRVIIRPPGQSGKAKRGHLCFDAAFETGNLGRADLIGDYEYDLFLRPDTCNPRFRFWFNFTVDNVKQEQRVIFNIVNISKCHNLFNSGLTPLIKSSSRPKWQRLPKKNVFYYRSAMHQNHHVLSFAFTFDREEDVYQFAVTPPYSYSRLQSYLNVMDSRQSSTDRRYERSVLTKTLQGRNLDMLTVDHVSGKNPVNRLERSPMRLIVILCRSYGAEAPASFVCQGFIEFLASSHPIAHALRENFVFKIVPMVNPDGVFLGNNRCNLVGQDMNRTWHLATEFSHPTLFAIKSMLKELDSSDSYQIDFVIDLHANSSMHGCFIYGNTYEDVYRHERHLVFPRLFANNASDYVADHMMFNADERKGGSARRFFCERLSDSVNTYSLEISMGGHYLKDGKTMTLYTEDGYYRCGRNLARTFLQYYRFINVLPMPLVKEVRSKRQNRLRNRHSRSRSKTRYEVKGRQKTERCYAPISYTNISIGYDSAGGFGAGGGGVSSDEGGFSPTRPAAPCSGHFSGYRNYRRHLATSATLTHEQFSLMSIKSAKFDQLHFSNESAAVAFSRANRLRTAHGEKGKFDKAGSSVGGGFDTAAVSFNVPPKPYLSIIDLNQLTRSTLGGNFRSLDNH